MTTAVLIRFAIALWACFALANILFAAMGTELRWRGVPIKWLTLSFNLRVRLAKVAEVVHAYLAFKKGRQEFPVLLCLAGFFASGLVVVPLSCLVYFLFA